MNPGFSPYQALLWVGASPARIVTALVLLVAVTVCAPVGAVVLGCAGWRRIRRAAAWVRALVGSWVALLAWQWSTRPVRHCACCQGAEPVFQTRAEVFGPLGEFGPSRMPRREPQHVPPQVLPAAGPEDWAEAFGWAPGDDYAWFGEPEDLVPLSLDDWIAQCQTEYERKRAAGGDL